MISDYLYSFISNFWMLSYEMAPYLFLGFMVAGLLHKFLPSTFVSRHMGDNSLLSVIKASVVGMPLPLCSCGVLPVAASLRKSGASKGPSLSFLITTPVTGVDSILATYALLGWIFMVVRVAASFVIGLTAGLVTAIFNRDEKTVKHESSDAKSTESLKEKIKGAFLYGFYELPVSIAGSLLLGLAIGAVLTSFIPPSFIQTHLGTGIISVLVAISVAIPLYVCATGSIPIGVAMIAAGFSPGAALAFLIAGPATNMVAITTVKKILGLKTTIIYLVAIFSGALLSGLLFDYFIQNGTLPVYSEISHHATGQGQNIINIISSVLLLSLLMALYISTLKTFNSLKKKLLNNSHKRRSNMPQKTLSVPDMTCNHCKMNVTKILNKIDGLSEIDIDVSTKVVVFNYNDDVNLDLVLKDLENEGYPAKIQ